MTSVQRIAAALGVSALFSILAAAQTTPAPARRVAIAVPQGFSIIEASIGDMQSALAAGRVTSHELVRQYLARIGTYEPLLHAVLAVNADALAEADRLDRERARGQVRG